VESDICEATVIRRREMLSSLEEPTCDVRLDCKSPTLFSSSSSSSFFLSHTAICLRPKSRAARSDIAMIACAGFARKLRLPQSSGQNCTAPTLRHRPASSDLLGLSLANYRARAQLLHLIHSTPTRATLQDPMAVYISGAREHKRHAANSDCMLARDRIYGW